MRLDTMFNVSYIHNIVCIVSGQDNVECNHMLNSIQIIKFDE